MPAAHNLRLYSFIMCTALCRFQKHSRKHPIGTILCILCKRKCHLPISKRQFCFELVLPYQGAVVFAVLVGQVGNGGCNAGAEELLSLVKVALMNFIEELMISAHISIRRDELI